MGISYACVFLAWGKNSFRPPAVCSQSGLFSVVPGRVLIDERQQKHRMYRSNPLLRQRDDVEQRRCALPKRDTDGRGVCRSGCTSLLDRQLIGRAKILDRLRLFLGTATLLMHSPARSVARGRFGSFFFFACAIERYQVDETETKDLSASESAEGSNAFLLRKS